MAVVWLCFAARVTHTLIPTALPFAMFLAVWLLYATDRLLDAHPLKASKRVPRVSARSHRADLKEKSSLHLQPRHHFHRSHRTRFTIPIMLAVVAMTLLIPTLAPTLLRPYLVLASLLAIWFAVIHLTHLSLPKEFAPGLFFAAAVIIPIPHAPVSAFLLAALCTINCLYIHLWEHPPASRVPHPHDSSTVLRVGLGPRLSPTDSHPATRLAIRHLPTLTLAVALLALAAPGPIAIAVAASAIALLALDHLRRRLSPTNLRAAADLALLTPILILPFLP